MNPKLLFCFASGPSLNSKDCLAVKQLNIDVLTVNNSWEMAPWCNYLYAGDYKWWSAYANNVPNTIEKWTSSKQAASKFGLNHHDKHGPYNSGMRALFWAMEHGYNKIFLLGYDCSIKNGAHWHGLHDKRKGLTNPNTAKTNSWQEHFLKVRLKANVLGVSIMNCSRFTELSCFKIAEFEQVIEAINARKKSIEKPEHEQETIKTKTDKIIESVD